MAIKIPILTSFDPKGLKQANAAFAGLQTSIGSLASNFAIVGAGIAGATALLGKAVMSASNFEAEFEGVNQVFKDAAGSVQAFAEQASASAGLSATEALQAAKTFGLFATGAGLGVEAAADFSTTMVQLAGDLGSFNDVPTAEALAAIQSGLMGQAEPLRKFGVFLDDARLKAEALNMGIYNGTGPLTTQQKMMASYSSILAQTTVQQGDFVKYGDTLGNQLKTINADFQNLTREIGLMLIPVITEAMPYIKEMATQLGEKLKAAIQSVDWKSLIQSIIDLTFFFVQNIETIARVVAAIFILNTAFKLMAVASGIAKTAIALQTWVTAQMASGMTLATIATNLLSAAMRLIPFVAVVSGLFLMVDYFGKTKTAIQNTLPQLTQFETNSLAAADTASRFTPYLTVFRMIAIEVLKATGLLDDFNEAADNPRDVDARNRRHLLREQNRANGLIGSNQAPTMPDFASMISNATAGIGAAVAPVTEALQTVPDTQDEAAAKLQAKLDAQKAALESFRDAVKQLYGQIKDSIMSAFSLPNLGNSIGSITRNMQKLLAKTKSFATNISQLSKLGLNSNLLQQVIAAGPMAGGQLAAAIAAGGSSFVGQLNAGFAEMGSLAGSIASTGTQSAFANKQTVNNYSVNVTGGVATSAQVGQAVVNAIKTYERQSGAAWRA